MSWFGTLVDIGVLSMQVSQSRKLNQLQDQQANAVIVQAMISAMRDEIFKYKQAAGEILRLESENPKIAAGAMRFLEIRLRDLDLKPEMFFELGDKEYVAEANRLIFTNSQRMIQSLPHIDQNEIESLATDLDNLPEMAFYLNHYPKVSEYRQAKQLINSVSKYNHGCLNAVLVYPLAMGVGSVFSMLFGSIFDSGYFIGFVFGLFACLGGMLYFSNNIARRKEFLAAKKTVEALSNDLDIETFAKIEGKLGTDQQSIQFQYEEVTARVKSFFLGSPIANILPS